MTLKNKGNIIKKDRYDIIVFIQAPADLRYALNIYKKNEGKDFLFCIVNVEGVYKFVKDLPLQKTEIVFIEYIRYSLKKPLSIFKAKAKFNLLREVFNSISMREIYFFSRIDDYLTGGIIGQILKNKNINVFYYNHYDDKGLQKINRFSFYHLKSWLHSKISFYITGTLFISRYYGKPLEFAFWKYNKIKEVKQKNNTPIDKKFLIKSNVDFNKKNENILFFISSEDLDFITTESKEILIKTIKRIGKKESIKLFLKGHPRIGTSEELKPFFSDIIPDYIPSEFIDYKNFSLIVGIGSTALIYPINLEIEVTVISFVKDIIFKNIIYQKNYIKYLDELTNNKIKYLSLEEIEKLL